MLLYSVLLFYNSFAVVSSLSLNKCLAMKKNTQKEFTLHHQISKPAGVIFNCLTDMKSFVGVHPIINNMEYLGENTYKVSETLPWGLIPCSIRYRATVEIYYESKKIVMTAAIMRFVNIEKSQRTATLSSLKTEQKPSELKRYKVSRQC